MRQSLHAKPPVEWKNLHNLGYDSLNRQAMVVKFIAGPHTL